MTSQQQFRVDDLDALARAYEDAVGIAATSGGRFLAEDGWTALDYRWLSRLADHAVRTGSHFANGQQPALDCPPLHAQRVQKAARPLAFMLDAYALTYGKAVAFDWLTVLVSAPRDVIVHMHVDSLRPDGIKVIQDYQAIVGNGSALLWAAGLDIGEAYRDRDTYTIEDLMALAAARGFTFPAMEN